MFHRMARGAMPGPTQLPLEAHIVGIAGCIILIAIGAIITFATDWHAKGVKMPGRVPAASRRCRCR
jgi:hypothetical protein